MDIREDTIDDLLQARSEIDEELRRHKTRITVLFTDVVGSTNYFDRFGDTAGLLLLHRHDNYVRLAVGEFDGNVIKTIGDSVMAEFPEPLLAVRAAIEIQRRLLRHNQNLAEGERLQIRTGINCGVGFRRSEDLFGDAVNVAARITKRGGPGQILISRSVQESLVETEIVCKPLGIANLDGKIEPEELYEVLWDDAPADSPHVEASKTPSPAPVPQSPSAGTLNINISAAEPVLARYQILERVGVGGIGVVFKACDRETGDIVALKVLRPEIADQSALVEGLKNELRLARKITHKNVCRIYDFNRSEGTAFITMEFVQGESLRRVLNRFGALNLRKAIAVARQICDGLSEAHSQGIVHRDMKPENLMIDEHGNVKLMDFGLAHLVSEGSTDPVGTPSYMAPEQTQDGPIDQRADIYALGLVLFEVFTGTAAFKDETPAGIALRHIQDSPRNPREIEPAIPEPIGQAILRCLEEDPARRFQSVEELHAVLLDQAIRPHNSRRSTWSHIRSYLNELLRRVRSGPRAPLAVAASMFLGIGLIIGGIAFHRGPAGQQRVSAGHKTFAAEAVAKPSLNELPLVASTSAMPDSALSATRVASLSGATIHAPAKSLTFSSFFDTVTVPAGVFMMGSDHSKGDEKPQHRVRLKRFRITRGEITNRQYVAFLEDTGYQRPKDPVFARNYLIEYSSLPVINVSYQDALEFCKWATKKFGMAVRLPTEAEWEYAARGGKKDSAYPWGTGTPQTHARYRANAPRGIAMVERTAFAPNRFGLYNMSGNVSEWVSDFYSKDYYQVSPIKDPAGPATGLRRVIRGGSWADAETDLTVTRRGSRDPRERSDDIGFRVVIGSIVKPPAKPESSWVVAGAGKLPVPTVSKYR